MALTKEQKIAVFEDAIELIECDQNDGLVSAVISVSEINNIDKRDERDLVHKAIFEADKIPLGIPFTKEIRINCAKNAIERLKRNGL